MSARAVLDRHRSAGRFPGAVWWIGGPDAVEDRGAIGFATIEPRQEAATEGTPFDLASLTKPLATALLLVLLERDGAVDLEAEARTWLPELAGSPWGRARPVDLATHRTGLPAWRPLFVHGSTLDDYLRLIAAEPPASPPGTTVYSDLGFLLLGAIVERVAGARLDRAFRDRVASPLGLARTGFAPEGARVEGAAATERGNAFERSLAGDAGARHAFRSEILRGEVHDANAHGIGGVAGHAGLFGTAGEVAAIACEMLTGTRLGLSTRARDLLFRPVAGSSERTFGLALSGASESARGVLDEAAVGHSGFTGTSLWLDPRQRRVFVLLTNRVHPNVPETGFDDVRRDFHRAAGNPSGG